MVADSRDRSTRLVSVAVLTLVIASSLPLAIAQFPVGGGATASAAQLHVEQGEARIYQGASAFPTHFVTGNSTAQLILPIYNEGTTEVKVPVYFWFDENATFIACQSVIVKMGDASKKGMGNLSTSIPIPRDVDVKTVDPDDDVWTSKYTVRILVNREPVGLPQYQRDPDAAQGSCPDASAPTGPLAGACNSDQAGPSPTVTDCDSRDNMAVTFIVVDRRLDLVVQPGSLKWCRGDPDAAFATRTLCDTGSRTDAFWWNHTANMFGPAGALPGEWFNTTRQEYNISCSLRACPSGPGPNQYDVFNSTYFEFNIVNNATYEDAPVATWSDATDWGAPDRARAADGVGCVVENVDMGDWYSKKLSGCPGLAFDVDIRVGKPGTDVRRSPTVLTNTTIKPRNFTSATSSIPGDAQPARSVAWHLVNWTGPFVVYAAVNDHGALREVSQTNDDVILGDNEGEPTFEVAWTDLQAEFVLADLPTTITNPLPYPVNSFIEIKGAVNLTNLGSAAPWTIRWDDDMTSAKWHAVRTPVSWRVTLDNKSSEDDASTRVFTDNTGAATDEAVGNASYLAVDPWTGNFTFRNSTVKGADDYISPGVHVLCVEVDVTNETRETNEANNKQCVPIYLADDTAPKFETIGGKLNPRLTDTARAWGDALTSFHPGEDMYVHANVTDDDLRSLTVVAQFTLNTNASVVRNFTMSRNPQFQEDTFSALITNFTFNSTNVTSVSTENWTLRVQVRDGFGNNATSQPTPLQLKRWPIQSMNASDIVLGMTGKGSGLYPDGSEFNYSEDDVIIQWRFVALENQTGIKDQPNVTSNMGLRVFMPNNKTTFIGGQGFRNLTECPRDELPIGNGGGKNNIGCTDVGHFLSPYIEKEPGGPGRWYAHIEIKDKGGDTRVINRTFVLRDALPLLTNMSLNATELEAGQSLQVKVNVSDDFRVDVEHGGVRANFTRHGDNKTFSVELKDGRAITSDGKSYAYNNTIETGYGKPLDEAGEFDVVFAARDDQGNWGVSAPIAFKLNDTRAPDLHEALVDQPLQEVGQNVTWTARVTDQTNVSVKLRVHPAGSDEDVLRVNLTPASAASRNFTHTANFTREGNYVWEIYAIDSAGLTSSVKSGPLTIADNLGPRFQVVEPGVLVEGKRYARAAPTLSLIISDTHGVDKDSINVSIGGQKVNHDAPVAATGGLNGFIVNYTVPASEKFRHNDTVTVNVTAKDLSSRTLPGWSNFTFTVDDVAPVARVKDYAPRFPTDGAGTVNVSLKTRFTLEATDNDGLPTGVESIRYRIFGGGNNAAETVYNNEPFTIADTPGVYTGPKIYQIQYWAVDEVGNVKTSGGRPTYETLTVYVDGIAPSLDPFGSLPQGRFVNATFIDDRSGVDRATVWYSVNGAPYVPLPLDFVSGVWSAVLPEGKKGDRVSYYLEAFDRVDNRETFGNATEPYSTYAVGNHVPHVKVTAPVEGSRIARVVDLTWTATDEDGDPLVFTVFVKDPGATTFRELAKLEAPDVRKYAVDTNKLQDGQYTFRVTVTDGSLSDASSTTVTVLNRASAFGTATPPPESVDAGTPVVLSIEVTKAQAQVEARLYRDGELVNSYPMNDEGRDGDAIANDGKYSARVTMDDGGTYKVEFHAVYQEDGVQKEATIQGGEVVVEGGGFGGMGLWLVLIGIAVVAGVAIAAVLILRGRKGA